MNTVAPVVIRAPRQFFWEDTSPPCELYPEFGRCLAETGDLYRDAAHGEGLIMVRGEPEGERKLIHDAKQFRPVIGDHLIVQVHRNGRLQSSMIKTEHLNAMLASDLFLQQFRPLDHVIQQPVYLPDYQLVRPGYNDGGPGHRFYFTGSDSPISDSQVRIRQFLDAMDFASNADRTNAVAAALTMLFWNFWPGGKPLVLVTATKSHSGKDTVIDFAAGMRSKVSVSHEAQDWALQKNIAELLKEDPDVRIINVENVRMKSNDHHISSAFLERLLTDPRPAIHSTGSGDARRQLNQLVMAMSTNFGAVSTDLMNRALPIHLAPDGNPVDRPMPIGNPRHEFLPDYRAEIAAELRGMVECWKQAGMPEDSEVKHSFLPWARCVGGMLRVNGFKDFLANFSAASTAIDPVRNALGMLGADRPDEWLQVQDWVAIATDQDIFTDLVAKNCRTPRGRQTELGKVMTHHRKETFSVEVGDSRSLLKLERQYGRFEGATSPTTRYRFTRVEPEAAKRQEVDE